MRRFLALLAATLGSLAAAVAQAPSAWSRLPVPAGVNITNLIGLGKLIHYAEGGVLHVYSAFTRRWQTLPISGAATIRRTNDCLLIQDGTTWHGFGASRGRFAALTVSPGAIVVNPSSQSNDSVLFVRDGAVLHAFSGFTGRWTSRAITAAASTAVERHTGLLADGTLLSAYDAYTGQWHDVAVAASATALSASGVAGAATVGGTVHAFSALHRSWTTAALPANANQFRGHDWVVWLGGGQALGYSGLTGTFATTTLPGTPMATTEDLYGLFRTSTAIDAFSAFTATWQSQPVTAADVLRSSAAVALLADGQRLAAYSAPLGRFVVRNGATSSEDVAGCIAGALDLGTGQPVLFSAMTGQWYAAPAQAQQLQAQLSGTAALLPTNQGLAAFSARSGAFVPLASAGGIAQTNQNGAAALAWDATGVHCFDARRDRWLSLPRTGAGQPTVSIWRTGALVIDGNEAIAFATQSGNVERVTLGATPLAFRANSESVGIATPTELFGFSSLPLPTSLVQFPDFRRAYVAGAPYRLQLRLLPGEVAVLGVGLLGSSPIPVPGFGQFLLDPAAHGSVLLLPEPDADRATLELTIPGSPALRGLPCWFQALVLPAAGNAFLSEGSELWIQ